jgi:hypothetical protein
MLALSRTSSLLPTNPGSSSLHQALTLLDSVIASLNDSLTSQNIKQATLQLLQLPEPKYKKFTVAPSESKAATPAIQATDEFYGVSAKHVVNDLRKYTILKHWEQGRLKRWWKWHDAQLFILQSLEKKRLRRREFLTQLRTHPWMNNGSTTNTEATKKIGTTDEQELELIHQMKRIERNELLLKMSGIVGEDKENQIPIQEILGKKNKKVNQVKKSEMGLEMALNILEQSTPAVHREKMIKEENVGECRAISIDFWEKFNAEEELDYARDKLKEEINLLLVSSSARFSNRLIKKYQHLTII